MYKTSSSQQIFHAVASSCCLAYLPSIFDCACSDDKLLKPQHALQHVDATAYVRALNGTAQIIPYKYL